MQRMKGNETMMKRLTKLLTALLLAIVLSSVAAQNDTIVVAQPTDLLYADPNVAKSSTDSSYHMAIWDALVSRDAQGVLQPMLAESWENPTPTEWIFHLRHDVRFTNGEPLNAHSVIATIERVMTPMKDFKVVYQDYTGFASWEALDDYTVKITTKAPDPIFLGRLIRMFITPPDYIAQVGNDGFEENPIGSGPYKFVKRVKGNYIRLEANPDYWQGAPKVRYLEFRIIPDEATRIQALKAGDVDIVSGLSPDQFDILNRGQNTKALEVPSARVPFIWLYPSSPQGGHELADVRVRQALNYAVNVDAIIQYVLAGHATRIATQVPILTFAYDKDLQPYSYDPEKAKALLAEAGYPDGFALTMEVPQAGLTPKPVEVGEAIAADLAKVGVRVTVTPREFTSWFKDKTEHRGAPMMLWSWGGGDYFDPEPYIYNMYHPESTRYVLDTSEDIWKLVDETRHTTDQEFRKEVYQQIQSVVKDEAWMIFLYNPNDLYGVDKKLVWQPRADERIIVWNAYYEAP